MRDYDEILYLRGRLKSYTAKDIITQEMALNDVSDSHDAQKPPKKGGFGISQLAFLVSALVPLFLLGVMMATHSKLLSVETGFTNLTLSLGPKLALGALSFALLSLLISLFKAPQKYGPWAIAATLVAGATVYGFYAYQQALKKNPPITEVATNWDRPLSFTNALMQKRGRQAVAVEDMPFVAKNESMHWGGRSVADINADTCPGAKTFPKGDLTAEKTIKVLREMGLTIFGVSDWRVEAQYQDKLFGFTSDVVVRLDPQSVDIRASRREAIPDVGENCRLVTQMVANLKAAS